MKALYAEKSDIITAIVRINKRVNAAANEWQLIALSVLAHLVAHGNKNILDCITGPAGITKSNGVQKSKMVLFLSVALKAPFEDGAFQFDKSFRHQDIDVSAAGEVKWYDMKAVPAVVSAKTLGELLAQFEKGAKASVSAELMTDVEYEHIVGTFEGCIAEHVAAETVAA